MKTDIFKKHFVRKFDQKAEGLNMPLLPVLRINALILQTLMEVAEFHQLHIDEISLKHECRGPYTLTINGDTTIILRIQKAKEAAHA